jgi:tRNA threonylcarbamoyladenosine biosynthesis protein TsaB
MVGPMKLLAIDTASEKCSVGIAAEGRPAVLLSETLGRGHAERLFGMIASAMAESGMGFADLGRIAVTVGPGSFTGVRIGIAAARGLALVLGCPVAGIGTLDVLAEAARAEAGAVPVLAVIDARRDEVYAQAFDRDGRPLSAPAAGPVGDVTALLTPAMVLAGSGARLVAATPAGSNVRIVHHDSAADIAALVRLGLAALVPVGAPRPLYVRLPDAKPQTAAAVPRR